MDELLLGLKRCVAEGGQQTEAQCAELVSHARIVGKRVTGLAGLGDRLQTAHGRELMVVAATAMRQVMQLLDAEAAADEATAPAPDRRAARKAARERKQKRALDADRAGEAAPRDRAIETLPGIGKVSGLALRGRGIETVGDLVWMLPLGYRDERRVTPIGELSEGAHQVSAGRVVGTRGGRRMSEVTLCDLSGEGTILRCVWFNSPPGLTARFREGLVVRVAGEVESFRGDLSITHPQTELVPEGEAPRGGGIVPRYPIIAGVAPKTLTKAIAAALERALPDMPGAVPGPVLEAEGLCTLPVALSALHQPPIQLDETALVALGSQLSPWHRCLAFQEFFMLELALHRRRADELGIQAEALVCGPAPLERARAALGFELTGAQRRVIGEIDADMQRDEPMRRLLQGDVGSGKTAVAMMATARAVAAGAQVALMAPTEVLAEQHFRSMQPVAEAMGIRLALVLGGARASHRRATRKALGEGRLDLVVGTHALLTEGVEFQRLRLVIVDEQHRFGVGQRLRLVDKAGGLAPHLLVMTATPIPRTLTLALHGDLQSSVLDEMPPGRQPPVTRAYPLADRDRALHQLQRGLDSGGQAYVVCPVIEESEEQELRTAEETFRELSQRFGKYGVGLLHGRLANEEKQRVMGAFSAGELGVLVSTTVIEVGVDVPRANVMLIEQAERFGLAQLHQLRGRVGRGGQTSACLLVHEARGEEARARIEIMCESHDGFRIAEEDLRLRGPGELFGRRQSGLPGFRFGDLRRDAPLLERAREAARAVIEQDPELALPQHRSASLALERLAQGPRAVVREEAG